MEKFIAICLVFIALCSASLRPVNAEGLISVDDDEGNACVVLDDAVHCWGNNHRGQLGFSSPSLVSMATRVGSGQAVSVSQYTTCRLEGGGVHCFGLYNENAQGEWPVAPESGSTDFAAFGYYGCSVIAGALHCWGNVPGSGVVSAENSIFGPLTAADITDVDVGPSGVCYVQAGTLNCFGKPDWSVLAGVPGAGAMPVAITSGALSNEQVETVAVGSHLACAITAKQQMACWGGGIFSDTPAIVVDTNLVPVEDVTQISVTDGMACAVSAGGVLCLGSGFLGRDSAVGYGTSAQGEWVKSIEAGMQAIDVAVSPNLSCVLFASNAVKCWGENLYGQLGLGKSAVVPTPEYVAFLGPGAGVDSVDAGFGTTCATVQGGARCWGVAKLSGSGVSGGYLTAPLQTFPPASGITHIRVGDEAACAHKKPDEVYCWGDSPAGALGLGATTSASTPAKVSGQFVAVDTGSAHTCAVTTDAKVKCWGKNEHGQLGVGDYQDRHTPQFVWTAQFGSLQQLSGAQAIATGDSHSCAIVGAAVFCWGSNISGQVGLPDSVEENAMATLVTGLPQGQTVLQLAVGDYHSCATMSGGATLCWGSSPTYSGGDWIPPQLLSSEFAHGSAGGNLHHCLRTGTTVYCWGGNWMGQLGNGTSGDYAYSGQVLAGGPVTAIGSGSIHACAVMANTGLKCWGYGKYGQLGNGDLGWRNVPTTPVIFSELFKDGFEAAN